jgi:mono/diheme cytochrome c family protein
MIPNSLRGRRIGGLASPSLSLEFQQIVTVIMRAWLPAVRGLVLALAFAPAISAAQIAVTAEAAAKGEDIYSDFCWTCHGEKLRNPGGGTSFDLRRLKPEDYARFVNAVFNGKNTMPPWRGVLDAEQIDAIWAYIRATVDR